MKILKELLHHLSYQCICGSEETAVSDIANDTRKVTPGCLFFCIEGANRDGHDLAPEAVEKGAAVLIVQKEVAVSADTSVTVIRVADTREAMAVISANY